MVILELWKPPPEKLNTYFILGEIVFNVNQLSDQHPNIDTDMLRALADGIREDRVETEDALRALCQIFRDTYSFDFALDQLGSKAKAQVSAFVEGIGAAEVAAKGFETTAPPAHHRHKIRRPERFHEATGIHRYEGTTHKLVSKAMAKLGHHPVIFENAQETKIMEIYADIPFSNWTMNVKSRPSYTCVPTTIVGIQNLVKTFSDRRIRCSGYRHSSSPIFADDGDILVSLLPLRQATCWPGPSTLRPDTKMGPSDELRTIQVFPSSKNMTTLQVRVGVATTVEEFRHWGVKDGWALPVDIPIGNITMGGLNGSICRGSGYSHKTVNDHVRGIEYVDANGNLQAISDRDELLAAAGCFGLLGIVTHITYEVNKTTCAIMRPRKIPTMLAVPPVDHSMVPDALHVDTTDDQLKGAVAEFEQRAEKSQYAEWAWFPYQSEMFVNTWESVLDEERTFDSLSHERTFLQWLCGWIGGVISSTDFYADIPARWQTQLLATTAMAVFPPTSTDPWDMVIKTPMPNAQHLRGDYQHMRVRSMELKIPIAASSKDPTRPDFTMVRKAWWEVVHMVYSSAASPLRLSVEMRIMADSDLIMAPQRGNSHGTLALEVATVPDIISDEEWQLFCQQLYDRLRVFAPGGRVRPHWAKEWYNLSIDNMPITQHLKNTSYKTEIPRLRDTLQTIGKRQGWSLKDLQHRFSNKTWDEIIFDD